MSAVSQDSIFAKIVHLTPVKVANYTMSVGELEDVTGMSAGELVDVTRMTAGELVDRD